MATSQSYIVGFSQESGFWEIKAGLIESISVNAQIRITETGDTFTLSEVNPSISKVLLPQKYDRSKQYHAEIIASFNNKIIVAFAPQVTEIQKNIFNAAFAKSYDEKGLVPRFFEKIEDVQFASFLIHCEGDDFYLTTKKDVHTPLFLRCPSEDLAAFFDASEKVGKWFIVKDLNNPSSALTTNDIKVEIATYSASSNYERPIIKNWQDGIPTECAYDLIQDTPKQSRIALSITNNARKPLWVSVAFLSSDFSITNKVIPTGKELVEHADKVRLNVNGEEKIWLSIPKGLRQKNVLEVAEYFKIFVSTDELSTDSYNQSELPMDLAVMRNLGAAKSIGSEEEAEEPTTIVTPDWRTYDVELRIKMPTTTARVIGGEGGAAIANHAIVAPSGFEADISIGATSDAQRSIGVPSAAAKLEEADFQPYFLSPGMATGASQSTLTFKKVENAAAISVDNSIKISLPNRSENEMVVAMAYDPETGLYYPTGFENTQGELEIHTLPDATNDGQRSLGGSVVMFLQKVSLPITTVLGKAKTDDDFYKLRIAKIPSDLGQETEYEADKAKIAAEISKAKKIILFVHGIIGDTTDQVKSLKRMNTDFDYDVVLAFDYENLDSNIEDIAAKLKAQLESIGLKEQHGKELHFVVHSMGGLVSRWFIEQLGGDKVVTQLVMIGTPNNGSEISSVTTYVSLGVVGAVNFACTYFGAPEKLRAALSFGAKHGTKRLLNTLSQMNPDGDFIKKLNEKGQESTVPYHIIAGDIFAINLTFKENGIFKTLMGLVERGAGQLIYKQSNDIAVRVESIKNVKGVGDDCKFEIAVDHMSYFADPKGVTQLEFVLQKINSQPTNITPPIPRNTTTVAPKSNDIPPIVEASSLGFLRKLIAWIKNLF
jgi:pimeloyl-ACP methyl ester carboxylesterase